MSQKHIVIQERRCQENPNGKKQVVTRKVIYGNLQTQRIPKLAPEGEKIQGTNGIISRSTKCKIEIRVLNFGRRLEMIRYE